jgi:CBS domain-containing protein
MGEHKVSVLGTPDGRKNFIDHLLKDIEALQKMHESDMIEKDVTRIGAEQEVCLVDSAWRPAPINLDLLENIKDPHFTTELARFNIEINLDPLRFKEDCLSKLERKTRQYLLTAEKEAKKFGAKVLLTGILPTIKSTDVTEDMMTPMQRYRALNEIMLKYKGGDFEFRIEGADQLIARNTSVMFESCNTSFQVHYQVEPSNFAEKYNWAQVISAPLLGVAVNSPLLFGKRLWKETRLALFQQSVDIRDSKDLLRERSPRVSFGTRWVDKSVVEVFQDDIIRYKILISNEIENDSLEQLENGIMPSLDALRVHNSTIYKWNRPCMGVSDNVAHLRIENRLLPAGPTLVDQVANLAFWSGMMHNVPDEYSRLQDLMDFDDARSNLLRTARQGIDVKLKWLDKKKYSVQDIVLKELLPIAREGLKKAKIDVTDIDNYLGIIEDRTKSGKTGARWILNSYSKLRKEGTKDEALVATTAGIYHRQRDGLPIHLWDNARITEAGSWINYYWRIDQIMATDLFAVQQDDYVDLVASIMDWRKVRHVPVENKKGELVGLITSGLLVKYLFETRRSQETKKSVKEIMIKNPISITPETLTKNALTIMIKHKVGCLPVVKNNKLVGIVTEHDFVDISHHLLRELSS